MNFCPTMIAVGGGPRQCGLPAGVKIRGKWFCEEHADLMENWLVTGKINFDEPKQLDSKKFSNYRPLR